MKTAEEIRAAIAEVEEAIEGAKGWGAAVGARIEKLRYLRLDLDDAIHREALEAEITHPRFNPMQDFPDTWNKIPQYMHEGILQYVINGRPPGGFLTNIFTNNFRDSILRADADNLRCFPAYASLLLELPSPCWGSREKVDAWVVAGGLVGRIKNG